MTRFKSINIGVRSQSVFIYVLTILWWLSLFHDVFFTLPHIFWVGIGYFSPFILALFGVILVVSSRRAGRPHKWWVRVAMLCAISPWVLFFVLFIFSN